MNCCTSGFGLFRISSGVPCAIIEPCPSIIIRVAMRNALVMSWVTTTAVMWFPCVSFKVSLSTTAVMIGSRPEVGSSLNNSSGSSAKRARKPYAFSHAAADFSRLEILETGQANHLKFLFHDFLDLVWRLVGVLQKRQRHILAHGERRE